MRMTISCRIYNHDNRQAVLEKDLRISDFAASRFGKTLWAPHSCLVCIACPELFPPSAQTSGTTGIPHSPFWDRWDPQNPGVHHVELGSKWGN